MGLTNAQYDEIMREYEARQISNRHINEEHLNTAYSRDRRLKEIDDSIASYAIEAAKRVLYGDQSAVAELKTTLAEKRSQREDILETLGYEKDFFSPVYTCPDCKDTGYINGQKCHCLKQAIIDAVYTQSNIKSVLERENFTTLSMDYYSREQLPFIESVISQCHDFVDYFDERSRNLLFTGGTGVGKTFLSNCIAKELLDSGHSVIYFSSFQLFDILSKGYFKKDSEALEVHKNIFDCDLLIIDDLGTELVNQFTESQLFLCVNERILRQKSTIISSNLKLGQLAETYGERTISRIGSNYSILKLTGDDLRIKRKMQTA